MSNTSRYHGIENHIGKTPLIRLRRLSELTGCEILGNAEFMNPGETRTVKIGRDGQFTQQFDLRENDAVLITLKPEK